MNRNDLVHEKEYFLILNNGEEEYNEWYIPSYSPDGLNYGKWRWSNRKESEVKEIMFNID
jgi:hypothetical protein